MKNILSMGWFSKQKSKKGGSDSASMHFDDVTVLIVEDSRTQLYAMERLLQHAGINTLAAENGKQGILMARHKKPDLILMDIVMPEINGFQATRYLTRQADTSHIPIIIISGSDQESDKAWGLKLGARDYMQKPADKNVLLGKIRQQLSNRKKKPAPINVEMAQASAS